MKFSKYQGFFSTQGKFQIPHMKMEGFLLKLEDFTSKLEVSDVVLFPFVLKGNQT